MNNVKIQIVKASESSGNIQFFVRAVRTDFSDKDWLDGLLEYECFQTKHLSKEECLHRCAFSVNYLLKFFSKSVDDIELRRFDDSEKDIFYKEAKMWCR